MKKKLARGFPLKPLRRLKYDDYLFLYRHRSWETKKSNEFVETQDYRAIEWHLNWNNQLCVLTMAPMTGYDDRGNRVKPKWH